MNELHDRAVLVVEDEPAIAAHLTRMLNTMGCRVIGPADRNPEALLLLVDRNVDAAILDVMIAGEASTPVAEELLRRGIPWVFASANPPCEATSRYPHVPLVSKPFSADHLRDILGNLLHDQAKGG